MSDDAERLEALQRVFREHPEWVGKTDSKTLSAVQQLAAIYQAEISLSKELEEVRRRQFAEEARQSGEAARRSRDEQERLEAEQQRAARQLALEQQEQQRQEDLARMGAVRRWAVEHRLLATACLVGAGIALVGVGLFLLNTVKESRERADAEISAVQERQAQAEQAEQAAAEAEAAAEELRKAQAEEAAAEAARLEELKLACDRNASREVAADALTNPDSFPVEVWEAWLDCPNEDRVQLALRNVPLDRIPRRVLSRFADTTDEEIAGLISAAPNTDLDSHKILVRNWDAKTVGTSYALVYKQSCSVGTSPENYVDLRGTTWEPTSGVKVLMTMESDCTISGYGYLNDLLLSGSPWVVGEVGGSPALAVLPENGRCVFQFDIKGDKMTFDVVPYLKNDDPGCELDKSLRIFARVS